MILHLDLLSVHCSHLHAISGCDTTSRLFGISKGCVLKKLTSDKSFQEYAEAFHKSSKHTEVKNVGENVIGSFYSGLKPEGLIYYGLENLQRN